MTDDRRLDAVRAVAETALRLGRGTTSLRLALAHVDALLDLRLVPAEIRDEVARELTAAREQAHEPVAPRDVERILRAAWGAKPTDELDDLELEPHATTPSAQVHRGTLDGRPVAVKVLKPGLREVVRSDLGIADALVFPLAAAFPHLDAPALVAEVRERVLDELDLEHEGAVQRTFARALRGHATLTVPAPVSALTHESVLVSEWIDGTPVGELTAPAERERAAQALVLFHIGSARFGTVHADPHPGNALAMPDGRTAFLDFGASRRVEAVRVDEAVRALQALRDDDGSAFAAALDALGWLPEADGAHALRLVREIGGAEAFAPGATLDAESVLRQRDRARGRAREIAELAMRASVAPADLWPLRMLAGLGALLARLEPSEDLTDLALAAAHDGWG